MARPARSRTPPCNTGRFCGLTSVGWQESHVAHLGREGRSIPWAVVPTTGPLFGTDWMCVKDIPMTTYAQTVEGEYLAYQVLGDGPVDLVLPMNGGFAVDLIW